MTQTTRNEVTMKEMTAPKVLLAGLMLALAAVLFFSGALAQVIAEATQAGYQIDENGTRLLDTGLRQTLIFDYSLSIKIFCVLLLVPLGKKLVQK